MTTRFPGLSYTPAYSGRIHSFGIVKNFSLVVPPPWVMMHTKDITCTFLCPALIIPLGEPVMIPALNFVLPFPVASEFKLNNGANASTFALEACTLVWD